MRMTSESEVISRLKTPTGNFCSMATYSAMFMASDVLPMLGPRRNHNHFSAVKSRRHLVKIDETRPHPGEHSLPVVVILDDGDGFVDEVA